MVYSIPIFIICREGEIVMLTNVKMKVTPELSEMVQEICFKNGVYWSDGSKEILKIDTYHILFINKNYITYSTDYEPLEYAEEVSVYTFIATQGKEKWLPKHGEEVLVRDFPESEWKRKVFSHYDLNKTNCYKMVDGYSYRYCKPLSKQISFIKFLKDEGVYDAFMNNCKIENQRWGYIGNYYSDIQELKDKAPENWLTSAFNWEKQSEGNKYWRLINYEWEDIVKENENIIWGR